MAKRYLSLTLLLCLSAVGLNAHGIWFAQRAGHLAVIYGEGADDEAIVSRLSAIRDVVAYDADGVRVPTRLMPSDYLLFVDTQHKPAFIAAALDNGIWTVTAEGSEVNKPKSEVPKAKSSGRYYKYALHVLADVKQPIPALPGQTLQLVPVATALPRRSGDSITLRGLFEGKPLPNAAVIADFVNDPTAVPLRTAADGTITLTVRNQGLNVISVVHEIRPPNTDEFDAVQHRATLSFVVPPRKN